MRHIQQNISLPVKDTKTFTLIDRLVEKECHRSNQKSAKTNLKSISKSKKQHVLGYLMTEIRENSSFEKIKFGK